MATIPHTTLKKKPFRFQESDSASRKSYSDFEKAVIECHGTDVDTFFDELERRLIRHYDHT